MTKQQKYIISSWVIGPSTCLLALRVESTDNYNWVIVLLIGFGICRYLRREFPKNTSNVFDNMGGKSKVLMLMYFVTLAVFTFYIVIEHQESINYSDTQFLVFLFALTMPLIPGWIKDELYLYKWAGDNTA